MQLTFSIIILLIIPSVNSLKCYVCNSNDNIACASDNGLNTFTQTCKQTIEPYCRKIMQTVDKRTSIIRTCGSNIGTKACYKTAGLNNAYVCSCNEDLCNNARNFKQQGIMTIVFLLITMILLR